MCERKLEQGQKPQTHEKKILWYIDDQSPEQIAGEYLEYLKHLGFLNAGQVVYNNLRTGDDISGVQTTCRRTEAEIFSQVSELAPGHCYILDHLHAVEALDVARNTVHKYLE